MDSFEFNNITTEKAKAMRNYNRQNILKKLELVTALALLAWSFYNYIPADFLRHKVAVFGQPLYVFLAVNILIIVISVLPSQKPTKQHFYDDYVSITTNKNGNVPRRSFAAEEQKPSPEVTVSEKQIVCVDNVVNSPVKQSTVGCTVVEDCEPVCPVREITVGTVMRRSETLIKSTSEVKIDDLSSEEFRMTIDTFIADKKKTLIKENSLDLKLLHKIY